MPAPKVCGERQGLAKMTEVTVRAARAERADGAQVKELAERYGVSRSTMSSLLCGNTWAHVQ